MSTKTAAGFTFAIFSEARIAELQAAFTRVQNKENWKLAIDVALPTLTMTEILVIREAVIHFTGSVPTFTDNSNGTTNVYAVGYYAAIGA